MSSHVIKYSRGSFENNGDRRTNPTIWCGRKYTGYEWLFGDAQHVALAAGGSVQPCKSCIKAIIKELEKEL